jgi:succinoglycan biosynthesis protein ExoM
MTPTPHICICICTYKRAVLLKRLLLAIDKQKTQDLFTYSAVIVDNDAARSAEETLRQCEPLLSFPLEYRVEPRQNISLARNMAVASARGDYLAFIDDDEFPIENWLLLLFTACNEYRVDGVLGPVLRHFDEPPPRWVLRGSFYDRPVFKTGTELRWTDGRTGNVLLRKHVFAHGEEPFRAELRGGEDRDFFRRMIGMGYRFTWCSEPVAYEVVPPIRWSRTFMLRRALLRGTVALANHTITPLEVAKSLLAAVIYAVALPFALLLGQHRFMDVLVRLFDHLGKLLALVGLNPVKEPYVTE